jgi:hypothetical protein
MSETRIETDVVYEHDQLGEVLVTGIAKMYDEWDTAGPTDDISSGEVLVFYHDRFDGYGGMQPTPDTDNINEFAKQVTRDRAFDYDAVSDLRVDE